MRGARATFKLEDHDPLRLARIRHALTAAEGFIKVGVLEQDDARQVKQVGAVFEENLLTNAEVAFLMEFGSSRTPERSWLRATFDANRSRYLAQLERMLPLIAEEKLSARQAFDLIGQQFAADCKRRIQSSEGMAPLAESTIRRKGSSRPLIDTGQMLNSITYAFVPNEKPEAHE